MHHRTLPVTAFAHGVPHSTFCLNSRNNFLNAFKLVLLGTTEFCLCDSLNSHHMLSPAQKRTGMKYVKLVKWLMKYLYTSWILNVIFAWAQDSVYLLIWNHCNCWMVGIGCRVMTAISYDSLWTTIKKWNVDFGVISCSFPATIKIYIYIKVLWYLWVTS